MTLTEKELRSYSLRGALARAVKNKGKFSGLEAEISDSLTRELGEAPEGLYLPAQVLAHGSRALSAGQATAGGFTVGEQVGAMVPILRHRCLVARFGAQIFEGLKENLSLPRATATNSVQWLGEGEPVTPSDQHFGALHLTPHRITGQTEFSTQLLVQTGGGIETFVRNDICGAIGVAIDAAAVDGDGGAQPLGILRTPGVGTFAFEGAATWSRINACEAALGNLDADSGSLGYLSTPNARKILRELPRGLCGTRFVWEDDGRIGAYPAGATLNVPGDRLIFGNFSDLVIASWGPAFDVVLNPFTLAASHKQQVTIHSHCDVGALHAQSFIYSTDSAAQ